MGTPQDTVTQTATYLDSAVQGLGQAAAALRAIDWTGDPGPPPPPPPPPGSGTLPDGYNTGNDEHAIDNYPGIAKWRGGAPLQVMSVFNFGHLSKEAFAASYTQQGWMPARTIPILAHLGIVPLCTITGSVGQDKPDVSYADVAAGALDDMHRGMAQWLGRQPWRTRVGLRLSRELGTPGPWYRGDTPADWAVWRKAHVHLFNDIYAPALGDKAYFVFCTVKRDPEGQWIPCIPIDEIPKDKLVIGVDAYFNKPYDDSPNGFADHWQRFVDPKVEWADKHGLKVGFPETAVTDEDQPGNLGRGLDYFAALAKAGKLDHAHYFGNTDRHAIFPLSGQPVKLPKSAAAYVEWWHGRG